KLDSNGNYLDSKHLSPQTGLISILSLKIDNQNNVYLTGGIDSAIHTFCGVTPDYGQDRTIGILAKFDNDFNLIWFEQAHVIGTSPSTSVGIDMDFDNDQNIYSCFDARIYSSTLNKGAIFQGDTIFNEIAGVGATNKYTLLKYNSSGTILWHKNISGNYSNEEAKFALNSSKDTIIIYGLVPSGPFKFDTILTTLSAHSLFIAKFDLDGNILDIDFIPHSATVIADVSPFSLQLSSNNNIYITGTQQQSIIFPDSTLNPLHGSGSNRDIFIAKYGVNQCFRCDSVQPAFTVAQNIGYTAQVSSNTTINAETYLWDFGNGQTSTDSLPTLSIVYPDTGTYTVCLTAQNYCDTQTYCQQIHIGCPPPLASGYTYTTGTNSIAIQSVNIQQYDSYIWYFGDGESSTDSLPQHNYTASGIYNVCIAVQNTCGTDSFCQSINITCPPPQIQSAGLHIDTLSIAGTGVSLQNQDSVYWTFGDGQNSTQTNPVHTYAQTGTYNVCLTAYNTCGDTTYCQEVSVVGTGIVQLSDGGTVKVYPNPAQSYINIELQNTVESLQVRIIDLQGKIYMKTKIKPSKEQLDLSNLSSGIYFIQLKDKQGEYSIKILKE
ncbi:MAG: PKD domain-containing protein, partial [Bacteroidetes bacterium]|nr:PKD domain-containing protein [Bacteroidota bacterium]